MMALVKPDSINVKLSSSWAMLRKFARRREIDSGSPSSTSTVAGVRYSTSSSIKITLTPLGFNLESKFSNPKQNSSIVGVSPTSANSFTRWPFRPNSVISRRRSRAIISPVSSTGGSENRSRSRRMLTTSLESTWRWTSFKIDVFPDFLSPNSPTTFF
ncbi:hypothetical protein MICRO11B_290067 [Micrococcus luteus]|nr:hypothetical protein MICRO11B_290067 [Micrococcus luteus]